MDFACPICKYPFGSGGKRVCIPSVYLPSFKSSSIALCTKLEAINSAIIFPLLLSNYSLSYMIS